MIEALIYSLLVINIEWRGNEDVVGSSEGCVLFSPADSATALADGLREMIHRREKWTELGRQNRQRFLSHYDRNGRRNSLSELLITIANQPQFPAK